MCCRHVHRGAAQAKSAERYSRRANRNATTENKRRGRVGQKLFGLETAMRHQPRIGVMVAQGVCSHTCAAPQKGEEGGEHTKSEARQKFLRPTALASIETGRGSAQHAWRDHGSKMRGLSNPRVDLLFLPRTFSVVHIGPLLQRTFGKLCSASASSPSPATKPRQEHPRTHTEPMALGKTMKERTADVSWQQRERERERHCFITHRRTSMSSQTCKVDRAGKRGARCV